MKIYQLKAISCIKRKTPSKDTSHPQTLELPMFCITSGAAASRFLATLTTLMATELQFNVSTSRCENMSLTNGLLLNHELMKD